MSLILSGFHSNFDNLSLQGNLQSMNEKDNIIHVDFGKKKTIDKNESTSVGVLGALDKFVVFSELIEIGTVMITLDARTKGVALPKQFNDEFRLNLNFCYSFGIPDFSFDKHSVSASLSFGGVDTWCDIPWDAVYMLRSHVENNVVLFPESLPIEMVEIFEDPDLTD